VFLSQYMQLARGATPTESGLLTLPMIGGLLVSSTLIGNLISRFGKWKGYMVLGAAMLTVGMFLMGTISYDTNYVVLSVYMFVLGAGVGMVMQNLVLIVQNTVAAEQMGASSAAVSFFRSLGGTIGVSVMGSVLGTSVANLMIDKADALKAAIMKLGEGGAQIAQAMQSGTIPKVSELPHGVRIIVESIYGQSVAEIFLIASPLALVTLIAVAFLPNMPLGSKTTLQRLAEKTDAASAAPVPAGAHVAVAASGASAAGFAVAHGNAAEHAEETLVDVADAMIGARPLDADLADTARAENRD